MVIPFWIDHSVLRQSSKGNAYAVIYARSLTNTGEPDWQQHQFISYNDEVLKQLRNIADGQKINLDLDIKEAVVQDVIYTEINKK